MSEDSLCDNEKTISEMRIYDYVIVVKLEDIISSDVQKAIKGHPFSHPKHAPVKIPYNVSVKKKSKIGYEQVKYNWKRGQYKYEARWHTATHNSPDKKQSRVVTRTKKGHGGAKPEISVLSGKRRIPRSKWQDAIDARKKGSATKSQLRLLERGHFTKKGGKKIWN